MVTVILLATLLTFMISLGPGAYKLMTTSVEDKLRTDANVMALEGWGKRAQRAMDNHLETYISFMALAVLAVYLGDRVGVDDIKRVALAGGWLYLISRVVHWLLVSSARCPTSAPPPTPGRSSGLSSSGGACSASRRSEP